MSNSSNIQVTLGYENPSLDPDINAILSGRSFIGDVNDSDDIEASIDIESQQNEADFDGNLDGFNHFLQLIDDGEFTQTIEIINNGPSRTITFDVAATNSQFSKLTNLDIAPESAHDFQKEVNVFGLDHITDNTTTEGNEQTSSITVHIGHGQTLKLNAVSTIDQQAFNHDDSDDIDVRNLGFTLTDGSGVDYGNGSVPIDELTGVSKGRLYLDPGDFSISEGTKGLSGFDIRALADSTLAVNFYDHEVSQEATTLRGYAEYEGIDTTPNDEGSLEREKTFFFTEFAGDVDLSIEISPSGTRSDELSLDDELTFLWLNRPDLDEAVNEYLGLAEHADPHAPDDLAAVYHQLLFLIDGGLGNQVYSTNQLFGEVAQFDRGGLEIDGETLGDFTQDVIGADLVNGAASDFEILTFNHLSGAGFGDFVDNNATDPNILYRIDILNASALDDLRWEHFTGDNVALVVVPPGADALRVTNGSGDDILDLSNTLIATSTGVNPITGNLIPSDQTGVQVKANKGNDRIIGTSGDDMIVGGEGHDTLIGGRGDDMLRGGKDDDIFVLAAGDGTDQIKDLRQSHDHDLIGLADGLTFDDLSFEGNKINFGAETLAILKGVDATTLTEDDFITIAEF